MEGHIRESLCSGSATVPGRPPLWETGSQLLIKELWYSGVWIRGPAFEGRAGTTTGSRWAALILAFLKITECLKFTASKARLGCYWQLSC